MRRIKAYLSALGHLLLGGCFLLSAVYFYRDETYSIGSIFLLAGVVCVALAVDVVKEN